jgi:hypothetical protein
MNWNTEAARDYEDRALSRHLRDWDVSEARDRAIEARAEELMNDHGEEGFAPFGPNVQRHADDVVAVSDLLGDLLPHLIAGDYASAGRAVAMRLRNIAAGLAACEAAIQIDSEAENAREAQYERAYEDRMGDY